MAAVQTDGDVNDAGGAVSGGISSVLVNGKPITVNGNPVSSHAPWQKKPTHAPHEAATTAGGSSSVKAGGIPVVTTGCADTCGHARTGGSGDVRIG